MTREIKNLAEELVELIEVADGLQLEGAWLDKCRLTMHRMRAAALLSAVQYDQYEGYQMAQCIDRIELEGRTAVYETKGRLFDEVNRVL